MALWEEFQASSMVTKVIIVALIAAIFLVLCCGGGLLLWILVARPEATPAPPPAAVVTNTPAPAIPSEPVEFRGWRGEYYNNPNLEGQPVVVRDDDFINFDWGCNPPAPGVPPTNFSVRWTISKDVPAGAYRLNMNVNDGARVWIDDTLIIDEWRSGPTRLVTADVNLVAGVHNVRVEFFSLECPAVAQAFAQYLQNYPDWKAEYFDNPSVSGSPLVIQNDRYISFNWGSTSPIPGVIPDNNYSVRWAQTPNFVRGNYLFRVAVEGGVRIWLDGQVLIDSWQSAPLRELENIQSLDQGGHSLRVEYFKETGNGQIHFGWAKLEDPGQPPVAVISGPARAVAGETVYFTARYSGVAEGSHLVTFNWDFGDGTTASGVDVNHVYTSPGIFPVTLTVVDDKGLSDTAIEEIEIIEVVSTPEPDQPPVAVIVAPAKARVGDVVTFDASYSVCANVCVSYAWDLGDGTRANAIKLQHSYLSPAVYNVILVVTDDKGLESTTTAQITIREAQATATPVPTEVPPVDTPTPTEEPPIDTPEPTEPPIDTPEPTEEPPPIDTPEPTEEPPPIDTPEPTEEPPQPSAVITYEPAQPVAGGPVQFSCEGSDPGEGSEIANCLWQFGDDGTDEGKNPTHVYDAAGPYTVTMTVVNSQGVDDTTTTPVTVTGE